MRVVYAVTNGGSTLDILGVFEDRALAEEAVAQWREKMEVYDDGWGIEELTVWDRLPSSWRYYQAWASVRPTHPDLDGKVITSSEDHRWVFEWHRADYEAEEIGAIARFYNMVWQLRVWGRDQNDVRVRMAAFVKQALDTPGKEGDQLKLTLA